MFEWVPLSEPLVAAVAGLAVLHLLTVYAAHRMRSAAGAVDPAMAAADDAVRCPECETVNERGYRFCRACVADLPAADGRAATGLGSSSRNPL
jgi:hypothetical protein